MPGGDCGDFLDMLLLLRHVDVARSKPWSQLEEESRDEEDSRAIGCRLILLSGTGIASKICWVWKRRTFSICDRCKSFETVSQKDGHLHAPRACGQDETSATDREECAENECH